MRTMFGGKGVKRGVTEKGGSHRARGLKMRAGARKTEKGEKKKGGVKDGSQKKVFRKEGGRS